jgi:hypothetical protein
MRTWSGRGRAMPRGRMPPWEAVFRVAWIPDEDAYRHVAQTQQETDDARM